MKKAAHEWYYWSRNQYTHYLVFRIPEDRALARAIIQLKEKTFVFVVTGPCWTTYQDRGEAATFEIAKSECERRVDAIIQEEMHEEYVHPLG